MARLSKTIAAAATLIVVLVALAGCSSSSVALDGTKWRLVGWTVSSLNPADFTITAEFANGRISGNGGVNSYSGPYKAGPGTAFSAGPLASTEMAGPEPAMRAESMYQSLLDQANSYKMADGKLTLYDQGGNESLIYEQATR